MAEDEIFADNNMFRMIAGDEVIFNKMRGLCFGKRCMEILEEDDF